MDGNPSSSTTTTPAAKTPNSRVFSESSKKQKKKVSKLLLDGFEGFQVKWPEITPAVSSQVLQLLQRRFEELNFKILTTRDKKTLTQTDDSPTSENIKARQVAVATLKTELVFGINEVTKGLEKNHLLLVIADHSTKPFSMISHLPLLAKSRNSAAVAVDGLSVGLADRIGVGSLVAFAFKKQSPSFYGLIHDILSLVPNTQKQTQPMSEAVDSVLSELPGFVSEESMEFLQPVVANDAPTGVSYKTVVIKRMDKNFGRAEKLKARQKRPPAATEAPLVDADVKAPGKRKAKMVKLGKRHRAKKL